MKLLEILKRYFADTSKEQQDKEWKEIEPLNDIGPDVIEYNNNKTMNENINLVEILKDAPKGTKLWSPIFGECSLATACRNNVAYPIVVIFKNENNFETTRCFTAYGKYTEMDGAKCLLFPSKDNRDWSTFKSPWKHKHFEPYQKVLVHSLYGYDDTWIPTLYGYYDESKKDHVLLNGIVRSDDEIFPYEGNEDKLGKLVEQM